ncbi:hypothetical protein ABZ491_25850 [Micromonospora rifamycinica]|uniref:hypothetical protein n=1 Tax=Micromonospora rifamycinica TaxID=291594 RepID=UPI00342BE161
MTRLPTLGSVMVLAAFMAVACTRATPAPASAPTTPAGTTAPHIASPADPDGVGPTDPPGADPEAVAAAVGFVARWARPQLDASRWLAALRPRAVPEYAALLATVDPANVLATKVTGRGQVIAATPTHAAVDVPTDTEVLRVICVRDGRQWLIATVGVREEATAR